MIPLKDLAVLMGVLSLAKVDLQKCPKRNGDFPKPGSLCKAYYKCSNWIPVERICPEDQLFNPVAGWCDWKDLFPCLDIPKQKECPRDNGRFLKPGTECKVYYDCCNGKPTEKSCPRDQLFDPNKEKCEWFELYTCAEQPEQKICLKENGRFLKPGTNCKSYYDCRYGKPTERECPRDQIFDPSKGRCEWIDLNTCVEHLSTYIPTVNTKSTVFETSETPTSDDNQNYKTSDMTSPPTLSQSSTDTTRSSTVYASTSGFSEHESTSQPLSSTTSSYTSSDPSTRTSSGIRLSTTYASTSGFSTSDDNQNYKTSHITSPPTSSQSSTQTSIDTTRSSTIYTSTSGFSDHESTSQPHSSTTSSYTSSDLDTQPSSHILGSSSTSEYTSTSGTSDYESTRKPHTSTISYTSSDPNIQSSTNIPDEWPTSTINIFCPEPSGYFPHPTDKHKFVGCVNDVPAILTCPSDLVYNHKIRQCDYERWF